MSRRYFGLVSSLPYLGGSDRADFQATRLPISRENLKARFVNLHPQDLEQIRAIIDFQQSLYAIADLTDERVCDLLVKTLEKLKTPAVRDLFGALIEVWTIVEALHQRLMGQEHQLLPPVPLVRHIRRNWPHPDFALTGRYPWITKARELLEQQKILELEQFVDRLRWQIASKASLDDPFGFETIVAYAGKWDILYRWNQVERDRGQRRFNELVESILKNV